MGHKRQVQSDQGQRPQTDPSARLVRNEGGRLSGAKCGQKSEAVK